VYQHYYSYCIEQLSIYIKLTICPSVSLFLLCMQIIVITLQSQKHKKNLFW